MESASSPPNQAAKRGVCTLTTSPSRRREVQLITDADQAQPTGPITVASTLLSELISESLTIHNSSSRRYPQRVFFDPFRSPQNTFLADTTKQRHNSQHQLQTSTSLIQQPFLHNQVASICSI